MRPVEKTGTAPEESAYWFVFHRDRMLLNEAAQGLAMIPTAASAEELGVYPHTTLCIGQYNDKPCFAADVSMGIPPSRSTRFSELRPLIGMLPEQLFCRAGTAFQLIHWERTWRFCPRCAAPLYPKPGERAKTCHACSFTGYPPISPAVIVAVVRDGKLLLAHSSRFRAGLYSVLAGFVEAGETLEECVRREIREEVNIEVADIRYFGSMSWPFPHSLMVGFTARHAAGEIAADQAEIDDAGWFTADALPELLPVKGTLSRQLIDWFVSGEADGRAE